MAKKKRSTGSKKNWMGMPMGWDFKNWHKPMWNPKDDAIFPPKQFGIGWTINFHAVCRKIGLTK
jgi:uncharacterized membrane protein